MIAHKYAIIPNVIFLSLYLASFLTLSLDTYITGSTFSLQSYGAADKLKETGLIAPMCKKVFRQPSTDIAYLGIPENFPTHFFDY